MKRIAIAFCLLLFLALPVNAQEYDYCAGAGGAAAFTPQWVYCNGTDGVFEATEALSVNYQAICQITIPTGGTSITKLAINIVNKSSATTGILAIYEGSAGGSVLSHCDFTPDNSLVECSLTQAVTAGSNYYLSASANSSMNEVKSDENSGNNSSYFAFVWTGEPRSTLDTLTALTGKIYEVRAWVQ